MNRFRNLRSQKYSYAVWVAVFLTVVAVVLVVNVLAEPGAQGGRSATGKQAGSLQNTRPCIRNAGDICISAPSVDLYPAGSEDAQNPVLRDSAKDTWKEIGGKIESIAGKEIEVRTSSGRLFTVIFPVAVQDWWNESISPHYDNYKVGIGDTVRIDYVDPANGTGRLIREDQLLSSVLAIDPNVPSSKPIQRYRH